MINNPVIVTALYDIGRDNWDTFNLSYDRYLWWMRNTLSLDANIVVFTESQFVEKITEYRKEFDPTLAKTIIIEKPLEKLDVYEKYFNKITNLMESVEFKKKVQTLVPEATKPLYNIVMFNKFFFLKEVKDKGYFHNDMLIWADAGGLREDISNYANCSWPSIEKINDLNGKITFFSHSNNISINNNQYHSLSQIRYIQGTAFLVPSDKIDLLTERVCATIEESIENGYIGSDEKILDIAFCKNPDEYNLIKCTWRQYFDILKNHDFSKKIDLETERMWYAGYDLPKKGEGFGGILENGFYINYLHGLDFLCRKHIKENTKLLELGCFNGISTRLFNHYTKNITTVDIKLFKEMEKLLLHFPNIKFIQQDSIEYLESIPNHSFDIIYIDTTNDYERTKKELLLCCKKVKESGFISGHDYNTSTVANAIIDVFKYPDIQIYLDSSWVIKKSDLVLR
jgi:hypothetical protein